MLGAERLGFFVRQSAKMFGVELDDLLTINRSNYCRHIMYYMVDKLIHDFGCPDSQVARVFGIKKSHIVSIIQKNKLYPRDLICEESINQCENFIKSFWHYQTTVKDRL